MLGKVHRKTIAKSIKQHKNWACTLYVQISKTKGVKIYQDKKERDCSYDIQKFVLKECGLAPKIFAKVAVKLEKTYYGYVTEHAEVKHISFLKEDEVATNYYTEGFIFMDCHWRNIGRLKNKKYVCIDFEPTSLCWLGEGLVQ